VVRARFVVSDESGTGVTGATQRVEGLRSSVFSLGSTVTRVLGALGVSVGFGAFARGVIGLNGELQQANAGMATLLSANYGMKGIEALGLAKSIVSDLRRDAAGGAGELRDYIGSFQTILGPGLRTGANVQQLRELNRNALAAGFALRGQEGMGLAGFDVQQALTGQVGDRTTPIVMQALGAAGITADAFRKLRPEERVDALNRAFSTFAEGVSLMGQTWDAQASTFKDHLKELARTATSPLFDRWSEQLRKANEWLTKNQDRLEEIAGRVGGKLVRLWDHLISQAGTYAALVGAATFAPVAGGLARGGFGAAAGAGALGAGGGLIGMLRGAWGWMVSSATQIGQAASWGANLPGRVGVIGRVAGGAAAGLGEAGGILGAFGQLLGKLALPLAIVTTAFLAVKGALTEFQAPTMFLAQQWGRLMESLTMLGASFGLLTDKGSVLNLIGAGLVFAVGGLIWALDKGIRVLAIFVVGLGVVFRLIGENMRRILTGDFAGANAANMLILEEGRGQISAMLAKDAALSAIKPKAEEPPKPPGAARQPDINIDKVEIQINTRAGHREIAGAFDLLVERTNRYRRQAVRRPAWSPG